MENLGLPQDEKIPIDCFYCGYKFVKTYQEILVGNGYICPKCGGEVGIKNPPLVANIEQAAKAYKASRKSFGGE